MRFLYALVALSNAAFLRESFAKTSILNVHYDGIDSDIPTLTSRSNHRIRHLASTNNVSSDSDCICENDHNIDFDLASHDAYYFWSNLIWCFLLVLCVAVISGLFLGLLTLDPLDLHIILIVSISDEDKKYANTLLPIVEQHHLVLVTLLLMNGIVYETLPLFMDKLVPTWMAIILSVTLVLFFGEIIPSAYFTGPAQLELASKLAPIMNLSLKLFWPIAYPLSKVLDYIVNSGEETPSVFNRYNRDELSALIRIQFDDRMRAKHMVKKVKKAQQILSPQKREMARLEALEVPDSSWRALKREILEAVDQRLIDNEQIDDEYVADPQNVMNPPLKEDEVNLVEGALQLKTKIAFDVYTPLKKLYSLPSSTILDKETVISIYANGHSRVPVYEERASQGEVPDRTGVLGYLMTRNLIVVDWDHEKELDSVVLSKAPCVSPRMDLISLTNLFQNWGSHMAFVCAQPDLANKALDNDLAIPVEAGFMGIVTLEDVLEELLQDTVYDELDLKDRDRAALKLTRWASERVKKMRRARAVRSMRGNEVARRKEIRRANTSDIEEGIPNEKSPLLSCSRK
jgi:metal transporter CNNM